MLSNHLPFPLFFLLPTGYVDSLCSPNRLDLTYIVLPSQPHSLHLTLIWILKSLLNERLGAKSQHSGGLRLQPGNLTLVGYPCISTVASLQDPQPTGTLFSVVPEVRLTCSALICSPFSKGSQLFCLAVSSDYEPSVLAWQVDLVPALPNQPFHSTSPHPVFSTGLWCSV